MSCLRCLYNRFCHQKNDLSMLSPVLGFIFFPDRLLWLQLVDGRNYLVRVFVPAKRADLSVFSRTLVSISFQLMLGAQHVATLQVTLKFCMEHLS